MQNSFGKAEKIKRLKTGRGIQYLLTKAYEILGNPILIHDMEYKTIDFNRNVITDDPIWIEYATKGTVGQEWFDFFVNECFIEEAANARKITFLTSDKLKYNRIYGKLFNKNNIQIGCAVMMACDKPFEESDPLLFEELCAVLSKEIGKNEFYNDYGQAYFEKLVSELIAGVQNKELYAAHVESIYMHLKSDLYLAVVDIGGCDSGHSRLAYYRDLFKKTQPEYLYAIYGTHICMIIGIDHHTFYVEKNMSKLDRLFRKHNIYAGVSRSFENLFDLNIYYKEALGALNGRPETTNAHIFLYE